MILPRQDLRALAFGESPMLLNVEEEQIQIASVDCRLGNVVYAMKSSALPQGEKVSELIERYCRYSFSLSGDKTNVLERGVCYIIPLKESLRLSDGIRAVFSPKSSTGRCDVFVRVLSDMHPHYDQTEFGYSGPLYLEVVPISFNVRIQEDLALTQFRLRTRGTQKISSERLSVLHAQHGIMRDRDGVVIPNDQLRTDHGSLYYHVDLDRATVGFESLPTPLDELDMTKVNHHDAFDFWRPIHRPKGGQLVLMPGAFYLLATTERTRIPPEVCGEILPYEISSGEIRPHYAGFFDNGFGGERGTTGVLEVRANLIPFRLVHNQPICRMDFEETRIVPDLLYQGNYRGDGPSLSKHFKDRMEIWGE